MLGNVMLGNVIQACDPFISLEELSNNTEWLSWQHIITVTIIRQVTGVECTESHYTMIYTCQLSLHYEHRDNTCQYRFLQEPGARFTKNRYNYYSEIMSDQHC